jgi:D-inositol-3-phosphate glycosyltransferase
MVTFHTLAAVKNSTGAGEQEPALRLESEKRIASQCSRILVATEVEKAFTSRLYDVPGDKIEVIAGGVNLDLFKPLDKIRARRQINLPLDDILILYVGRFDAMKGIDRVVESMAFLNLDRPARLLLVGGDDDRSPARIKLQDLAARLGIEASVHFAGRVEHERMPYYYSAADVVTAASHYESFGLVALEALACGTPVVATRVGVMDQVINPTNGCLVDRPSAAKLADGITRCVSASFRQKVSVKTMRASVAGYDWSRTAAGLLKTYSHPQ